MQRFTIDLPEELHHRLKIHCAEQKINMADVIRKLVADHLEKAERKRKK